MRGRFAPISFGQMEEQVFLALGVRRETERLAGIVSHGESDYSLAQISIRQALDSPRIHCVRIRERSNRVKRDRHS